MRRAALPVLALALGCATSTTRAPAPTPAPAANSPASAAPAVSSSHLPPIPLDTGKLALRVVYPAQGDVIDARDSSFLFGTTGNGKATLSINGAPVQVWPNGTWLAWLALPPDSVMRFDLVARTATDSALLSYQVPRTRRFVPPAAPVWLDSLSIYPRGRVWWPASEWLPVGVRAAAGAEVRIRWPNGNTTPLVADTRPEEIPDAIRAFDRDSTRLNAPPAVTRYTGAVRGNAVGLPMGPAVGASAPSCPAPPGVGGCTPIVGDSAGPLIEAIQGVDTVRARWPVQITLLDSTPQVIMLDDDTARTGKTDRITVGRTRPGATYNWFFPTGTRAPVNGRIGNELRLALSRTSDAWVSVVDAVPLPVGLPNVRATVGSVTLTPGARFLSLRIPLSSRVPFQVVEDAKRLTLRLYGTAGDVNWIRYGGTDTLIAAMSADQPSTDETDLVVDLAHPVWGYRTSWSGSDLLLDIRRPPAIQKSKPLAGRRIVVDPGHPPAGATGPSGFREAEANLAVALQLRDLLAQAGAEVIMTRTTDSAVDLYPRTRLADSVDAELLISIHNNALPDGVEPWRNNGSSVFYNTPRSIPLAMAVQRALVRYLGLRDLGVGRGDLALVRPTWMPSILSEGLFMMIPDQEAALRSREGQALYARAVFEGIQSFLVERAGM
ncbi:MAG TPA: N-acetylmuramoyl-L-alanine amidase [Gemmatimonadales bacterium]|nr:N-acetylmuramoyl-L-alanine amidase [Gemmatimonadales bacterium]